MSQKSSISSITVKILKSYQWDTSGAGYLSDCQTKPSRQRWSASGPSTAQHISQQWLTTVQRRVFHSVIYSLEIFLHPCKINNGHRLKSDETYNTFILQPFSRTTRPSRYQIYQGNLPLTATQWHWLIHKVNQGLQSASTVRYWIPALLEISSDRTSTSVME